MTQQLKHPDTSMKTEIWLHRNPHKHQHRGPSAISVWKGGTGHPQSMQTSETNRISELWVLLRDPASMNKVEEWMVLIPDINLRPTHTCTHMCPYTGKTCIHTNMHTAPHTHEKWKVNKDE